MIYSFRNDYSSIAHKDILNRLVELSENQYVGYGEDEHTKNAVKLIQQKIGAKSDVFFLTGGTATNKIFIGAVLKRFEAVISADTGHINVHETGAIEANGNKVLTIKNVNGKITSEGIKDIVNKHPDYHMVKPRMVYISNTTEVGSVYTKKELVEIKKCCDELGLYLYIDGARLASALAASDLTLNDYATLCDAFYIGGTKNGAPFGEALVINNKELSKDFLYVIKNMGGMLAKGYVPAISFEVLFEGDLYLQIGKEENDAANYLTDELKKLGVKFYSDSTTNQVFIILKNEIIDELLRDFDFEIWTTLNDNEKVIRLVTSFTTKKFHINAFLEKIKRYF
ncbi:MAG: aminotransferase class I/II-fold pyridoxal phosphate-dependent enzyme [Acholeplasmatales bacterium]|nr:aminotransferase class I/II-fold pyridoxal phosphate-dependent enzyme [Acholeplasmatales bacterium]